MRIAAFYKVLEVLEVPGVLEVPFGSVLENFSNHNSENRENRENLWNPFDPVIDYFRS